MSKAKETIFFMKVHFSAKFSLFLTILALPQFFPSTTSSILCSPSLAAEVRELGKKVQPGQPGINGQPGNNSDSLTVFADGTPMTLDLSGENGLPGDSGSVGNLAICGDRPADANYNIRQANGGDGGQGGDGGDGGNGGSLTVYTTEKSHLAQIYAIATGGEGGDPGTGGEGGEGCKCDTYYWNQQSCTGKPGRDNYNCTTEEFQCQDGYNGRVGRAGRKGKQGRLGTLTVINLDKSLTPDRPLATIAIAQLKDRGFTLSKNEWETKTGAVSLLAPGSIVADQYQELVNRLESTVLLVWDAPQPFNNFAQEQLTLKLTPEEEVDFSIPKDLWLETTTLKRDNITEFFVFNALKAKEATQLRNQGLLGNGSNLTLKLRDMASKSDLVLTDFSIRYRTSKSAEAEFRRVFDYKTKYEGKIPPEAIEYQNNQFTINIGQLPIPPEALRRGTAVEIKITADRSFADNSKQQDIIVRDILKR